MKKYNSLVKAFNDTNKQICKSRPAVEPGDIYLAYCALALCTIADKMTDSRCDTVKEEKDESETCNNYIHKR